MRETSGATRRASYKNTFNDRPACPD